MKNRTTRQQCTCIVGEMLRHKKYKDIDADKSKNNVILTEHTNFSKIYNNALKHEYYTKKDKYGRTHKEPRIKAIDFVTTFSPEANGTFDVEKWIQANKEFMTNKFKGCPMIATVHYDQTTPHIHWLIVPVTENGKICKNHFISGQKDMVKLHDDYAKAMQQFNLQRGEKRERIEKSHCDKEDIEKYRQINRVNKKVAQEVQDLEKLKKMLIDEKNNILNDINRTIKEYDDTVDQYNQLCDEHDEMQKTIKTLQETIKTLELKKSKIQYDIDHLSDRILDDNYHNPYDFER